MTNQQSSGYQPIETVHPVTICTDKHELSNVITHGIACVLLAAYASVRYFYTPDLAYQLPEARATTFHFASVLVTGLLFLVSVAYHASTGFVTASAYFRAIDRGMICISVTIMAIADLECVTLCLGTPTHGCVALSNLPHLPWQAYMDAPLLSSVAVSILLTIRLTRNPKSTYVMIGHSHAHRNTRRWSHMDGAHGGPLTAMVLALFFQWITTAPYIIRVVPAPYGAAFISIKSIGTVTILLFGANDMHENSDKLADKYNTLCAWLPRAHVLWHMATMLMAFVLIAIRDSALVAISQQIRSCPVE